MSVSVITLISSCVATILAALSLLWQLINGREKLDVYAEFICRKYSSSREYNLSISVEN
jgi:hypothetical protein